MKKIFIIFTFIFLFFSCSKWENISSLEENSSNKIKIEASIVPLASISNYIWWEFVEVKSIIPAWVSEHSFDLKPNNLIDIEKADFIVYLWLDHFDWFLNKNLEWKNVLKVSEWIELIKWVEHHHHEGEVLHAGESHSWSDNHTEEEHHDEHESHTEQENHIEWESHSLDPHFWASSENAVLIAEKIKNKLVEINPENKEYFEENFENFREELGLIKNDFIQLHSWKNIKEFIVFHDAYNYLFKELNIDNSKKLVFQENVLSDPNSSEVKELIDEIKLHGVNVAFKEPQLNDSNLKKLASDYNISVYVLDPVWVDISKDWYINYYKSNLLSLENIYE